MSLSYDASGRVCADETRGISSIEYDNDGHPVRIIFESGNEQRDIWDGLGNHLATEYYDTGSMEGKEPFVTKRYAGDGQIECQIGPDIGIPNRIIAYTAFPGGYFDQDGAPHYYITDYQGYNTAIVDSLPKIIEENNCYSYGEPLREKRGMPFLFSGNERLLLDGLNGYDFHARRYNAAIPAFTSWDALNEQYPWLSPYAYAAANPINFIDPSGQRIIVWEDEVEWEYRVENGTGGLYNANGDKYSGDSMILENLEEIRTANDLGEKMINALTGSDKDVILKTGTVNKINITDTNTFDISWKQLDYMGPPGLEKGEINEIRSPTSALAHELGHAYDYILPETQTKKYIKSLHPNITPDEIIPCVIENTIRTSLGDPGRMSYQTIQSSGQRQIDKRQLLFYTSHDYKIASKLNHNLELK